MISFTGTINPDVEIAVISALAAVVAAGVTGLFSWLNARNSRKSIGKANGKGTVVEMLEAVLAHLEEHGVHIYSLQRRMRTLERAHGIDTKEEDERTAGSRAWGEDPSEAPDARGDSDGACSAGSERGEPA